MPLVQIPLARSCPRQFLADSLWPNRVAFLLFVGNCYSKRELCILMHLQVLAGDILRRAQTLRPLGISSRLSCTARACLSPQPVSCSPRLCRTRLSSSGHQDLVVLPFLA